MLLDLVHLEGEPLDALLVLLIEELGTVHRPVEDVALQLLLGLFPEIEIIIQSFNQIK